MNENKKSGIYLMVAGAVLFAVSMVIVYVNRDVVPSETATSTATTVTTTATTTDIFAMEPVVPEAKVSTEGWKTCRNEEYGYEFKFPAEWHIYGEDAYNDWDTRPQIVRESEVCNGAGVLLSKTKVEGYPTNVDSQMYINVSFDEKDAPDPSQKADQVNINVERYFFLIDENNASMYWNREGTSDGWSIVVNKMGMIYALYGSEYLEHQLDIHTILSTFHFLDTTSSTTSTTLSQ